MAGVILVTLCCVGLVLLKSASSLKCRTGVQQTDDQFRKVIEVCKKRYAGGSNYGSDSSSREEDREEYSNADVLDKFLMSDNGNKYSDGQSKLTWKERNDNRSHGGNQRNDNEQRYSFNYSNDNGRNAQYPNHGSNNRNFEYSDGGVVKTGHDYNSNFENDKERAQACVVQCFFDELGAVDHRGFPEQVSVINVMTHTVQNPELQDLMGEIVVECFYYLSSDVKRDKCYFSESLLSCFAEKAKERCEDWDD